jgi:putative oxidoreductase
MSQICRGPLSLAGRVLLCTIFFMSAAGNKVPNFNGVAEVMEKQGVPAPKLLLVGAIVFLLGGSVSVIVGYRARFGAALLAVFLVLATYYFYHFWTLEGDAKQEQMIQFMKNLSMFGAMLFLIANGPGAWSVDDCRAKNAQAV